PDLTYSRPTVKSLTFDGQTSWTVFKTQFDVVSSANGWNNRVKASQLVASLRGSATDRRHSGCFERKPMVLDIRLEKWILASRDPT
ncbi:hypothetical protein AVEN_251863-1, partial [Araneus ventricosus]